MQTAEELIQEMNKEAGAVVATLGVDIRDYGKIPFTSVRLNYMTYGGVPRNCLSEFFGSEGSGKTTTSLDIVSNAQIIFEKEWEDEVNLLQEVNKPTATQKSRLAYLMQRGKKKVFFLDLEGSFRPDWAQMFSVKMDNKSMIFLGAAELSAEYILQKLLDFIRTDTVGLFILDSIPALVKKVRMEKDLSQQTYCGNSAVLADFSALLMQMMHVHECTGVMINQTRPVINSFIPQKDTPGGVVIKFTFVTRLEFSLGDKFDIEGRKVSRSAESPVGHKVNVQLQKTKAFPPDRAKGYYTLFYKGGIDPFDDIIDLGIKLGYINAAGAWISLVNKETGEIMEGMKFQGRLNLVEFLKSNLDVFDKLKQDIQSDKEFLY